MHLQLGPLSEWAALALTALISWPQLTRAARAARSRITRAGHRRRNHAQQACPNPGGPPPHRVQTAGGASAARGSSGSSAYTWRESLPDMEPRRARAPDRQRITEWPTMRE